MCKQGIGLHTGAKTAVALLPAQADEGIIFLSESGAEIPATADHVVATDRAVTLGLGDARVRTVEHLLGAIYGMGLDNVRVSLNGPEAPACDGSAREWVELLRQAGRRRLSRRRAVHVLARPVWAAEDDSWAMALPARGLSVTVGVDFSGTVIGRQLVCLPLTAGRFAAEVAPARTFAFEHELGALRAAGLAQGGGVENAFVVGPAGYSGPLRFPDEIARHKTLDLVGDLALCGHRFEAQVVALRPSHRVNVALAKALRAAFGGPSQPPR